MASFEQYITKLQELTTTNLKLLSLLNDSFYSRTERSTASIDGKEYTIPSFIYLENKLNEMKGNWDRLLTSPDSGEVRCINDGSSLRLVMDGFDASPQVYDTIKSTSGRQNGLDDGFFVEDNNILKDLVHPKVYMRYNLYDVPINVLSAQVKKIVIYNDTLADALSGLENKTWINVKNALSPYTLGVDYYIYDKTHTCEVRTSGYYGKHTVLSSSMVSDPYAEFSEYRIPQWTITVDSRSYITDNGESVGSFNVGDILESSDHSAEYVIREIGSNGEVTIAMNTQKMTYQPVRQGDVLYFNRPADNPSQSTLSKYIKIPLEENKHIMLFISPINSNSSIRSVWGTGVYINTYDQLLGGVGQAYKDYVKSVNNIGDVLNDISKLSSGTLSNLSSDQYEGIVGYVPGFGDDALFDEPVVELLNKQQVDVTPIKNIKELNSTKVQWSSDLMQIQADIQNMSRKISTTDFSLENTTSRNTLNTQLNNLVAERDKLISNIDTTINEIDSIASRNDASINNYKFVIRSKMSLDRLDEFENDILPIRILGIDVRYRYKSESPDSSTSSSIGKSIIVTPFTRYRGIDRAITPKKTDADVEYIYEPINDESAWDKFQIAIKKGEVVEIQYRLKYNIGHPFINVYSKWSVSKDVIFPDELDSGLSLQSILAKNIEDKKDMIVKKELISNGIISHVEDRIVDQSRVYFHNPENIASGFYTSDSRRVISLKEKLDDLNLSIASLQNSIFGSNIKNVSVSILSGGINTYINPNSKAGKINMPVLNSTNWRSIKEDGGDYIFETSIVLYISNINSKYPVSLYAMFPGNGNLPGDDGADATYTYKWSPDAYTGIGIEATGELTDDNNTLFEKQKLNQFLYFRNTNVFGGDSISIMNNKYHKESIFSGNTIKMDVFPSVVKYNDLQCPTTDLGGCVTVASNGQITIPISVEVRVPGAFVTSTGEGDSKFYDITSNCNYNMTCSVGFDIWVNPFESPVQFLFDVNISKTNRLEEFTKDIDNNLNDKGLVIGRRPEPVPDIINYDNGTGNYINENGSQIRSDKYLNFDVTR